jgi:hypothetical protein
MSEQKKGPVEYSEKLLVIAEDWPTYEDYLTDNEGSSWPCTRCSRCNNAILTEPGTRVGRAFHLIQVHGYRMDGRHEDEQQTAAQAAAERGEMNAYRP